VWDDLQHIYNEHLNLTLWGSAAGLALCSLLLSSIRSWLATLLLHGLERFTLKAFHMTRSDVDSDSNFIADLIRLRVEMKADRARVWAFVNGGVFTPGNPDWGIKLVYESCDDGVKGYILECQRIPVQAVSEIIRPLFGLPVDGVCRMKCDECRDKSTCFRVKKGQIELRGSVTDVQAMPNSEAKAILFRHGIQHMLTVPVVINANLVGFVSVDYHNSERDMHLPCKPLIDCAMRVGYHLRRSSVVGRTRLARFIRLFIVDKEN